jgi:hypothetical protein
MLVPAFSGGSGQLSMAPALGTKAARPAAEMAIRRIQRRMAAKVRRDLKET